MTNPQTTEIPSLDAAKGGTSCKGGSPTFQDLIKTIQAAFDDWESKSKTYEARKALSELRYRLMENGHE